MDHALSRRTLVAFAPTVPIAASRLMPLRASAGPSAPVAQPTVSTPGAMAQTPHAAAPSLPAPTGPYPVGRADYHWVDPSRAELYAEESGDLRELVGSVWYPAAPPPGAEPAEYTPAGWEPVGSFWGFETAGVRSHAYPEAPVASAEARYPVLLFIANGFPTFNHAAIIEDLASHGYIVVGATNTYHTPVTVFPDGRTVPMAPAFTEAFFGPFTGSVDGIVRSRETIVDYKVADLQSVMSQLEQLDQGSDLLAGRLDLDRLGAFGHSMGGDAALEFCRIDRRCRAAVNLDGAHWTEVGRTGLTPPAMLITVPRGDEGPCQESPAYPAALCEADRGISAQGWRVVAETAQPSYTVTVSGATHLSFMDIPFFITTPGSIVSAAMPAMTIDPTRMWRITDDYLLAFFARYLKGKPSPLLEELTATEPEVTLVVRNA